MKHRPHYDVEPYGTFRTGWSFLVDGLYQFVGWALGMGVTFVILGLSPLYRYPVAVQFTVSAVVASALTWGGIFTGSKLYHRRHPRPRSWR